MKGKLGKKDIRSIRKKGEISLPPSFFFIILLTLVSRVVQGQSGIEPPDEQRESTWDKTLYITDCVNCKVGL